MPLISKRTSAAQYIVHVVMFLLWYNVQCDFSQNIRKSSLSTVGIKDDPNSSNLDIENDRKWLNVTLQGTSVTPDLEAGISNLSNRARIDNASGNGVEWEDTTVTQSTRFEIINNVNKSENNFEFHGSSDQGNTNQSSGGDIPSANVSVDVELTTNNIAISSAYTISGNQSNRNYSKTGIKSQETNDDELKEILQILEKSKNFYVIPPLCTIGIIGNTLVASVLFKKRKNNSSFIYMFSFLLCDTLSLFSDLFTPLSYCFDLMSNKYWHYVAIEIRHWNESFVSFVLRGTAINIFCILSVERLMAVRYPFRLKSSLTVKHPGKCMLLALAVALFANILKLFSYTFSEITNQKTNTTTYKMSNTDLYLDNKENIDKIFIVMKFFAGPVQVLFFTIISLVIIITIRQNTRRMKKLNATKQKNSQVQVTLAKIFVMLGLTNALAFLPNSITPILSRLVPDLGLDIRKSSTKLILQCFKFFRVFNSASDFIIMLVLSEYIRCSVRDICSLHKIRWLGIKLDSKKNTSGSESKKNTPGSESQKNTPGSESQKNTPGSESQKNTPGSESQKNTPGSESPKNTPGSESNTNTPDSECAIPALENKVM